MFSLWCGTGRTVRGCWKTWDVSSPSRIVAPV